MKQQYHYLHWWRNNTTCIVIACSPYLYHAPRRLFGSGAAVSSLFLLICVVDCVAQLSSCKDHGLRHRWFWLRLLDEPTMCSIPLLPSMLGGVTPSSVIREILGEAGWTLCLNYGAASQRHAHGRFVLQWKIWWILAGNPSSPSTLTIKSTESWHLVVSIARTARKSSYT